MKFTKVELAKNEYLNYIFLNIKVGQKPVVAMFDTKGNSLLKKSIADQLDLEYIDQKPIDEKRGWKRARVNLQMGGLEIGSAPVVVANDETFDLPKDPNGNKFPADFILGWNIISQLCFRGNLAIGDFQVQIDDFNESKDKGKQNLPVLYINFQGERILAAVDTSSPITTVNREVFDKIIGEKTSIESQEIIGMTEENLSYQTKLSFKIDEDEIILRNASLNPKLDKGDVKIIFGADLLRTTTWAMYCPMRYMRARQN